MSGRVSRFAEANVVSCHVNRNLAERVRFLEWYADCSAILGGLHGTGN